MTTSEKNPKRELLFMCKMGEGIRKGDKELWGLLKGLSFVRENLVSSWTIIWFHFKLV